MKLKRDDISDRVIQRLTKYLSILHDMKKYEEYINSSELSKIMNTTSAQIRRDLSTFGEFGIRGKGYDIEKTVTFANIASGLSVVKIGGRSSIPEYDEIMKYFLQKYPDEGTIQKETPPVIATEAGM